MSLQRQRLREQTRDELTHYQLDRLNSLLAEILPANSFYREKLADVQLPLKSLDQLANFPLTTKSELVSGDDDWAVNRTFDRARYWRFHQTSGTHGQPLVVVDTREDWQWWLDSWQYVLDAAEITSDDVCMMAFSFGPFIGFWSAFDAAGQRGCLVVPGGGLSTLGRLQRMKAAEATVLFCTPTYALRMAEVAAENKIDLKSLPVKTIVVAGEPGGSLPTVREAIETAWNARVLDHSGATEIGPWGFGHLDAGGLFVNEAEFIAEFLDADSLQPVAEGAQSELVLTTLGRPGCPVLRYRTGDLVRPCWDHAHEGARFVFLEGGLLGRADDMMIVRGVNILPSAIEQILRGLPEVAEFRLTVEKKGTLDHIQLEVEAGGQAVERIAAEFHSRLGLTIEVTCVDSLPRFEGKAQRFIDNRNQRS